MKTMSIFIALSIYCLQNRLVSSISACDPLDVFFIVDSATIEADSHGVIKLIDSIISRGSNEETGYSVIIYGDDVPELKYGKNVANDNSILCEIDETTAVHNRPTQIDTMNKILEDAFGKIEHSDSDRSISFETALNYAKEEAKSENREYKNRANVNDLAGVNEDEDVFIVFDYNNDLGQSGDIEKYSQAFKDNHDQSIHWILGQQIKIKKDPDAKPQKEEMVNDPSENALRTHFFLFDKLVADIGDDGVHSMWDQLLDLTCPAMIDGGKDCKLGLGNHIQFIEADTIQNCELKFDAETGELDSASFLIVIDELGPESTATFQVDDTLMVDEKTSQSLPEECDRLGAVVITDLRIIESNTDRNILELTIRDHNDLSEFITGGKCDRVVDNQIINKFDNKKKRRLFSTNPTLTIGSRELVNEEWSTSANYRKTKYKNGAEWVLEADGTVTASYTAGFEVYVGLYLRVDAGLAWDCACYTVCWCWWGCCSRVCFPCWPSGFWFEFQVELQAGYGVNFRFDLDFSATASFTAPRLAYVQRESIAYIAGIPIKYRPWLEIDLLIEVIPMHANIFIDCEYGHDFKIGYEYKSGGGGRNAYVEGPTPRSNTCDKGWSITSGADDLPRKLGMDTTVDCIIGLDFYKAVSGQFIAEVTAPLHLTFTPDECSNWGVCDRSYKPAVLTLDVYVQPMWRIVFNPSAVANAAKALAASILDVFGISVPGLEVAPVGSIDKSNANKIGGPIKLWGITPICIDITDIYAINAFVNILVDKYCGTTAQCSSSNAYSQWVTASGCGGCNIPSDISSYCSGYAAMGDCTNYWAGWMASYCATTCGVCSSEIPNWWEIGFNIVCIVAVLLVLNIICVMIYFIRRSQSTMAYKYKVVSMETETEVESA